jgi:hypothetical protein
VKCLKKVFDFEYCEEPGHGRKAESTIIAPVRRDADHDLTETRYERRLTSTGPKMKTWKFKETLQLRKSARLSIL